MRQFPPSTVQVLRWLAVGLAGYLVVMGVALTLVGVAFGKLTDGELNHWSYHTLPVAQHILTPLTATTDGRLLVSTIEFVVESRSILVVASPSVEALDIHNIPVSQLALPLSGYVQTLANTADTSWVLNTLATDQQRQLLAAVLELFDQLEPLLEQLNTQPKQRWIVVLQNSDEIRASGGFLGSYALLDWENGVLKSVTIEDIYDAAGQMEYLPPAPDGVAQYLSGGKGWQLQDMNWAADFTSAAPLLLEYFEEADKGEAQVLIALNTQTVEHLLEITGPIELRDYNTTLSADNFTETLRVQRDDFFPGSTQKKDMLSKAYTAFIYQLQSLSVDQLQQALQLAQQELERGEILFYSPTRTTQEQFAAHQLAGALAIDLDSNLTYCISPRTCEGLYLYLLESNVGINKANRAIERTVDIEQQLGRVVVHIATTNKNKPLPAQPQLSATAAAELSSRAAVLAQQLPEALQREDFEHLQYINYQRLILSPNFTLESVLVDNSQLPPDEIDTETLKTKDGPVNQYGFLTVTPEEKISHVYLTLKQINPGPLSFITLQKQPGLEPVEYTITTAGTDFSFPLHSTTTLQL